MHPKCPLIFVLIVVTAVTAVPAQQQPLPAAVKSKPSFDVASVKPSPASALIGDSVTIIPGRFLPGGRFEARNSQLLTIIRRAYQEYSLRPDQIVGPSWLAEERYDIDARAADDAEQSRVRVMIQQLLADRFKMQSHVETRMQDVYTLVMARRDGRPGPQLRPPTKDCSKLVDVSGAVCGYSSQTMNGVRSLSTQGRTLETLVILLTNTLGRTVIDRTGLTGLFDVTLEWDADSSLRATAAAASTAPPLVTALQEQLELRLESTKAPADVLVIDHIERPTPD
jgi:uncharacterized protein (TIGR03435 family)